MYYVYEINSVIFLLSRLFYFWGVVLDLDKYIFPWQTGIIWGHHLSLVFLHLGKYRTNYFGSSTL